MTKKEYLLDKLKNQISNGDIEIAHSNADQALIEYINDKEIEKAYEEVPKWYA